MLKDIFLSSEYFIKLPGTSGYSNVPYDTLEYFTTFRLSHILQDIPMNIKLFPGTSEYFKKLHDTSYTLNISPTFVFNIL